MVTTRRQSKLQESSNNHVSNTTREDGDISPRTRSRTLSKDKTERRKMKATQSVDLIVNGFASEVDNMYLTSNSTDDKRKPPTATPNWRKDRSSIFLLLILYILQGIPLGFSGSIPFILMARKVDYKAQALFSFAFYPFSVKLLWAPIVDSVFSEKMGRRKSWLIPIQYSIGILMIFISFQVNSLLGGNGEDRESGADIKTLVLLFTFLNFFAATQDIVVDGWALNILSPENVGYASTCNTVGQTAGYFISYTIFLALESKDFCNQYIFRMLGLPEQDAGLITLEGFMYFWAIIFFIATTLVWIMKRETREASCDNVTETYQSLWSIVKLPIMRKYIFFCLTSRIAFAVADGLSGLKLVESGMLKENLALLAIPLTPVQLLLPLFISKLTAGPTPMTDVWLKAYPVRLIFGLVFAGIVYLASSAQTTPGQFPVWFYLLLVSAFLVHQVFVNSMFVSIMAFHTQISDPVLGGTYMTLLNTFTNLGGNWPNTVALSLVDMLTWKSCALENNSGQRVYLGSCSKADELSDCLKQGAVCETQLDGYYILSVISIGVGIFWFISMRRTVQKFQNAASDCWKVR